MASTTNAVAYPTLAPGGFVVSDIVASRTRRPPSLDGCLPSSDACAMGFLPFVAASLGALTRRFNATHTEFAFQATDAAEPELIDIVDQLRNCDMLDCLQLLHFHLGSQIPNIRNIRDGVTEACRFYLDLIGEGAPMGYLDIGGGLAVDYDG